MAARYASAILCDVDHVANEIDDTLVEKPIYARVTGEREGDGEGEIEGVTVDEEDTTGRRVVEDVTVFDEDEESGKFDDDGVRDIVCVPVTLRVTLGVTVSVPDTVMDAVPAAVLLPLAPGERLEVGEELIVLVNDSVVVGEGLPVAVGVSLSERGIGVIVIVEERGIADDVDDKEGVVLDVMLGVERDEGVPLAVPPTLRVVVGVGLEDIVVVGV